MAQLELGVPGGHGAALGQPALMGKDPLVILMLAGWAAANSSQSQSSGFHLPGEFTGKMPQWEAPHLPKVKSRQILLYIIMPRYELPEGGDNGSVSRRARGAVAARAHACQVRSDAHPGSSQPGRILHGTLGAAPSGTLLKKIKGKTLKIKSNQPSARFL